MVVGGGFEPPKSTTTDLQSVPFGHSGTPPMKIFLSTHPVKTSRADEGTRTPDLLITNQLLYQLSYVGVLWILAGRQKPSRISV